MGRPSAADRPARLGGAGHSLDHRSRAVTGGRPSGRHQWCRPLETRITLLSRQTSNGKGPNLTGFATAHQLLDERTRVIEVEGELDLARAPDLKWILLDALEAGATQLVLDFSRVTFIDSTAIGALIGVTRSLEDGARLAIASLQPQALKIFEVSGMGDIFATFATVDDALAYVRGQAARAS
jgi:anti-sigma B factor antagonist